VLGGELHYILCEIQLHSKTWHWTTTSALHLANETLKLGQAAARQASWKTITMPDDANRCACRIRAHAAPVKVALEHDLENMLGIVELC